MKKLVLIDSNALVHRAFHALPMLTSPSGAPTNAVYGFVSVLLKMIGDIKPDYIAATFDLPGPTFRHQAYEQYKAHRQKAPDELYAQIPVVKDVLKLFGIPIYEQSSYEADDVIGSISRATQDMPDLQTIIVTGDLDTLQLVHGEKVVVFTLRKGMTDTIIYDEAMVRERFGLSPAQVVDFKGLKGDPSDNIPGVPGIGDKTASALIDAFGSIEGLYTAIEEGSTKKPLTEKLRLKLVEHKDMALFSKELATIFRTVPIEFSLEASEWRKHLDVIGLDAKCKELGFYSLIKRINTTLGTSISESVRPTLDFDSAPANATSAISAQALEEIPASQTAAIWLYQEAGESRLSITTDGENLFLLSNPSPEVLRDIFKRYPSVIGHNIKPILKRLPSGTYVDTNVFDTAIAAWLYNPEQRDYSLERTAQELSEKSLPSDQASWPLTIWDLKEIVWDRMKSLDILKVSSDIEMPLIPVLARMEQTGIRIDTYRIDELMTATTKKIAELETTIYKLAGQEFNINSPAQLGEVLFTKLAIRGKVRKTGTGASSTAAPELEKLRDEHEIIGHVLEYRELTKLRSTYIEPFPSLIATDGRLHTTYNQAGAITGRLSSADPNLQNIPARTELGQQFRAAFVAAPGFKLVSLDYSQLELRIAAHIAKDETMIQAFRAGEDIHVRTASEILGIAPAQVTKDIRRQAKVLNFGLIYGMGVLGFARAAGVSRDAARKFIDEYFKRFKGIAVYMEKTKEEAFKNGYVSTIFGRRRPLPEIKSRIPQLVAQAERMAINHPIQGTEADLVKLAMIAVDRYIHESGLENSVRLLLQVHDELVLEVAHDAVSTVTAHVRQIMQSIYALDVPLTVDAKFGDDWATMELIP